jgi:hypothetical protein
MGSRTVQYSNMIDVLSIVNRMIGFFGIRQLGAGGLDWVVFRRCGWMSFEDDE